MDEGGTSAGAPRFGAFADEFIGLSIAAGIQPLPPVWDDKRWWFYVEPWIFRSTAMRGRARPWVVGRLRHHFGTQGILFHVSDGVYQMRFVQQTGEWTFLPKVTDKLVFAVEVLGMRSIQTMKDSTD